METALRVASYEHIIKIVRAWAPTRRFTLVQEVLKSLQPEFKATQPKRRNTLDKALGLLATNDPAPSDEDIEQWLDEYHKEKYG
jgi:hypothetical protein